MYCYRVMSFGLKNARATYQRATTTLFHYMMHQDDRADHLAAFERFFEMIRQIRLRLNPKKCTFGVTSRKLLGCVVSEIGIEADLENIRAILEMPTSRTEKEVMGFLTRLTNICEAVFRLQILNSLKY
ncbi:hypothetical protein AAG906_018002 [Vitis piasezkii]